MKLELKENMYVCNRYGRIAKIEYIEDNIAYCDNWLYQDYREYIDFINLDSKESVKEIIKASYDIIDLIEVGDYVNGYYVSKIWEKDEITHYVDGIPIKRKEREIVIQAPSYGGIEILKNKNIKSIVTKEQFEQMSYKVEV